MTKLIATPTLLQIDFQNLFFEAKNIDEKIDFEKILNFFNDRESEMLMGAIVYMTKVKDFDNEGLEKKLKSIGYDIRVKEAQKVEKDGRVFYRKVNHDILMTLECMDKLDMFEKWIFMSGDGDFLELCKYLKNKGKKVELWSFQNSYNRILDPYADKIYFIDKKFFYKKPKIKVFGPTWVPYKNRVPNRKK